MKKLMIATTAVFALSAQAAFYSWTDFKSDNRFMVKTTTTSTAADAYDAALQTIGGLKSGNIPRNLILIDSDGCKSVTSGTGGKAVSEFIAAGRGHNSKVDISGFTIGTSYSETGAAKYVATIKGDMPCLKSNLD